MSSVNSKMYTLKYDPGFIKGKVVLKRTTPVFKIEEVLVGYEWIEHDIGSWVGPQRIQTPKYEKREVIVKEVLWEVYTEEEFEEFKKRF